MRPRRSMACAGRTGSSSSGRSGRTDLRTVGQPRGSRATNLVLARLTPALATVACACHLVTTVVVSTGRPVYPDSLRALGIEGRVVVQVVVDSTGQVEPGTATVLRSTDPGFNQAAIDFVNAARFRPGRIGTRKVRVLMTVAVPFASR